MSGEGNITGEVLGASIIAGASIAVLPDTGVSIVFKLLAFLAIILGITIFLSFVITRVLKRVL